MAKDASDPLTRWRDAEAAYVAAASPYLDDEATAPPLRKKDLISMVELRGKADRWREKYYRFGQERD